MRVARHAHLDSALILPVRLVCVHALGRARCDLARALVEGDRLELKLVINVDCLHHVVRAVEEDQGVSRNVRLRGFSISGSETCGRVGGGGVR